ncbi:MAG: ATPase [Bacteroidales bacterium]|nr:ATPase [Bacteroidales bacterium]
MIIVADSGSTRTDWVVIKEKEIFSTFNTIGFNPYFVKAEEIKSELEQNFPCTINLEDISNVYFYGSGCSSFEMNQEIHKRLSSFFTKSEIEVEHDLLAAARALFGNDEGIAVILGTGANTCHYNGKDIIKNVTSLGFILGDEGGADHLGKLFIQDYLNEDLPVDISEKFYSEFRLSKTQIFQAVYKKAHPNRFLASFSKFIRENSNSKAVLDIIERSFNQLFVKHICKYENYKELPLRATGSVAFFYEKELNEVAKKYDTKFEKIIREPIDSLTQYHINMIV